MDKDKINHDIEMLAASYEAQNRLPALRTHLETEFTDRPYQVMAVYQRERHSGQEGEAWPNKPASTPAISRYPNILAELDASGYWLDRIARYAKVSMEIMAAAMEENGELSWDELKGLKRCFGCKLDYLISPALSMVDPATSRGKARSIHLKDLAQQTEGMDRYFYDKDSKDALPALERGNAVTYAAYRCACKRLQDVLDGKEREAMRQQQTRTGELLPVQIPKEVRADLSTRHRLSRERARISAFKSRLSAMKKYADSAEHNMGDFITIQNLHDLLEFSKRDLAGAIILAARYGSAIGLAKSRS